MANRAGVLSSMAKWMSAGACTAGALASASLLFQGAYPGDFLLYLALSAWLVFMGLSDFDLEPSDAITAKYLSESGRDPGKRGACMILVSLMLPCYTDWRQITSPITTLFILTKVLWLILLVGGISVVVLGIALRFCS